VPRKATIPNVIVRKYVKEYLDKRQMGNSTSIMVSQTQGDAPSKSNGAYSSIEALAKEAGTGYRRIWGVLKEDKNSTAEFIDKLFCAMDQPYLWREDPELEKYYESMC
jgi:hypothetical protein